MSELQQMVALSRRALARGEQLCMATVVHVEGSSYRKPGARMLLSSGGERAGTISGGCLEAEITRKAWWLTAEGAHVERYSSFADEDGGMPYGLGCGGTVSLLLERGDAVEAVLRVLEDGFAQQAASLVVSSLERQPGIVAVLQRMDGDWNGIYQRRGSVPGQVLKDWALLAATEQRSCSFGRDLQPWTACDGDLPAYWVEYLPAPPALTIFGAGDDARPIAALAHTLGWRITVADGRAHLAHRDRFPQAAEVQVLNYSDPHLREACGLPATAAWQPPAPGDRDQLASNDLAVILTHSYEQDRALLCSLLPRRMRYLGILGPRHRTERLLQEVAPALGFTVEQGFQRLHSPIGLDLGAGDPAAVALSIVAQVQAVLHQRTVAIERTQPDAPPCLAAALPAEV